MGYLTRQQILEREDIATVDVEVPEWGGTVRVKAMTGAQRDRLEASTRTAKGKPDRTHFFARMVAWCCVDEDGQRIFSEPDVLELSKKSSAALMRVAVTVQKLSAIDPDDVEALTGNSEPGPDGDSSSDWPGTSA